MIISRSQIERTHAAADLMPGPNRNGHRRVLPRPLEGCRRAAGDAMEAAGYRHHCEQTELREAIDWQLLMLALALLTIEWIARRRNLGY